MPVIINEFEVITEPIEEPSPEPAETEAPSEMEQLRPEDIVRIYRRQCARIRRVWAD